MARILVIDPDEVVIFPSIASAQRWLEPWQLERDELLVVLDEHGNPFMPRVDGLRVVLDSGGSVDLGTVRARLGMDEESSLEQAVDDYVSRYPKQMRP